SRQIRRRAIAGTTQAIRDVIGDDAIDFLRHRAIERSKPRLDVHDGHMQLGGGERARQRRVRVAVHEHLVGTFVLDRAFNSGEHVRGVASVRERSDAELVIGRRDGEFVKELFGHLRVVVLAGVDEHFVGARAQRPTHRGGLDELRPRSHDGQNLHARCTRSRSNRYRMPHAEHDTVTGPPFSGASSRTPHEHIHPARRAGTPNISAYGCTSPVTTAPAPMNAYSPIVWPQTIVAFAPIVAPRRTSVCLNSCFRDTWLRGLMTFVNTIEGPQNTSSSRTTRS